MSWILRSILIVSIGAVIGCSDDSTFDTTSTTGPVGGGGPGSGGQGGAGATGTGGAGQGGAGQGGSGQGGGGAAKRVFVTSTTFDGDLAGIMQADAECTALATSANLGGAWVAWLSRTEGTVSLHAIDHVQGNGPWLRIDGTQAFADRADLATGALAPVDKDETGATPGGGDRVWTGTSASGMSAGVTTDCTEWFSNASQQQGLAGSLSQSGAQWTEAMNEGCDQSAHLYCFEQ